MQSARLLSRPRSPLLPGPALTGTTCCPTGRPWSTRACGGSGCSSCRRRSSSGPGGGRRPEVRVCFPGPHPAPLQTLQVQEAGEASLAAKPRAPGSAKLTLPFPVTVFCLSHSYPCAGGPAAMRGCETGLQPPHNCLQDRFCYRPLSEGKLRHAELKPFQTLTQLWVGRAGRQPGSPTPCALLPSLPPAHTGGLDPPSPSAHTVPFPQGGSCRPGGTQAEPRAQAVPVQLAEQARTHHDSAKRVKAERGVWSSRAGP